jgi:predicted RNA methylase
VTATTNKKKPAGNRRVTGKEQYYTPGNLASELVSVVARLVPDFASRTVLEPAGGTGAFVDAATALGAKVVSFDIEPLHVSVQRFDFLEAELRLSNAVTISNPPFGRNNSLSIPFFNRAADHSEYIAFIVPRSWRKWSVINRLDPRFHLISDQDIVVDYVDASGKRLSEKKILATCFQVYQRRDSLRPKVVVADMGLVKKVSPDEADVALTIFGFSCGAVTTDFERVKNTTRMYLKLLHPDALAALKSVDFDFFSRNTAYTQALSLPEINYLLNERILGDPMVSGL